MVYNTFLDKIKLWLMHDWLKLIHIKYVDNLSLIFIFVRKIVRKILIAKKVVFKIFHIWQNKPKNI